MTKITYLIGDATDPQVEGNKIITHICNDIGAWGAGFVMALSRKWDAPERSYRALRTEDRQLGNVQLVEVENDDDGKTFIANMIGQHGCGFDAQGLAPIRYEAVKECLALVNKEAVDGNATIHMPRIGCGLAGGKWETIEQIIKETITVDVFIYDLN